jgi:threonine/homoserine/homoserine lactone efflux protein
MWQELPQAFARPILHPGVMAFLLGLLIGLPFVAPVGPVALTLFGVSAEQGRRRALTGAGGVVAADAMLVPIALGAAGWLSGFSPEWLRAIEILLGIVLGITGLVAVRHAESARAALGNLRRPAGALFVLAIVNPLSLVAWMGLALALPASISGVGALAAFGIGLLVASALWHAMLAVAGGSLARRLGDVGRTRLTQASGVLMVGVACLLIV